LYKLTGSLFHKKTEISSSFFSYSRSGYFLDLQGECSGVLMAGYRRANSSCIKAQRGASLPLAPVVLEKPGGDLFLLATRVSITLDLFSGPNLQNQMLVNSVKRFPGQRYQTISTQRDNLTSLSIDQYTKKPGDFSSGERART